MNFIAKLRELRRRSRQEPDIIVHRALLVKTMEQSLDLWLELAEFAERAKKALSILENHGHAVTLTIDGEETSPLKDLKLALAKLKGET